MRYIGKHRIRKEEPIEDQEWIWEILGKDDEMQTTEFSSLNDD